MVTCTQQHDYVGVLLSGGPAGVVQEVVLGQHLEHVVPAPLQEGGPGALDLAGRDVAELGDHLADPHHLLLPLLHAHGGPVGQVVAVGDGVGRHLVAEVPVLVHQAVVRVALEGRSSSHGHVSSCSPG